MPDTEPSSVPVGPAWDHLEKLAAEACGRVDAFFEVGLNQWDYAAGVLICEEAGAIVRDLNGGPPSRDFVFAASPGVADTLLKLLQDAEADRL